MVDIDKLFEFQSKTNCTTEEAEDYLTRANDDLDKAIALYNQEKRKAVYQAQQAKVQQQQSAPVRQQSTPRTPNQRRGRHFKGKRASKVFAIISLAISGFLTFVFLIAFTTLIGNQYFYIFLVLFLLSLMIMLISLFSLLAISKIIRRLEYIYVNTFASELEVEKAYRMFNGDYRAAVKALNDPNF